MEQGGRVISEAGERRSRATVEAKPGWK